MKNFKSFLTEISHDYHDSPELRAARIHHYFLIPKGHRVGSTSDISQHVALGHHAFSSTHLDSDGNVHTTVSIHSPDGEAKKVTL